MSNEPVAWMHNLLEDNIIAHRPFDLNRHPDRWTPLYKSPTPCETCQALARTVMMDQTSHDTHPAPQPVTLTDEEIYPLYSEPSSDKEMVEFARAVIEAYQRKQEGKA
jgi:hypothetical protein